MKEVDIKKLVTLEPPNTIVLRLKGALTEDQAEDLLKRIVELAEGLDEVHHLVDLTNMDDIPPKSRKIAARKLPVNYGKLALFGASTRIRVLGGLILKMMPQIRSGKFFETEEEARAWLAEEK